MYRSMNPQQIAAKAQQVFDQAQIAAAQYDKMGLDRTAIMSATVEQIAAHISLCEDINTAADTNAINYERFSIDTAHEAIIAAAEAKIKNNKRRAGVRALISKYGKAGAERIIESKAGRHYNLRG